MYLALSMAMQHFEENETEDYSPAIVLMTDGISDEYNKQNFYYQYLDSTKQVPIFSIMFGSASSDQLDFLAEISNARVFDGKSDLISAFKK